MRTRRIGRTPLAVTEVGFGGAPIGNLFRETSDDDARAAVDAALAAGIRYFDTAPHYGLGLSERRLGAALAERPRGDFVLSTKVGRLLVANPQPAGSDLQAGMFAVRDDLLRRRDYSGDGVRRSIDASLARLGTDRIDIVLIHDPDDYVDEAIDNAAPALISLRDQGIVGAVGVGMNQWQAPLRIVRESDLDIVMLAGRWTLADRSGELLMDECARRGVSVLCAAPYNSGLLAHDVPPDNAFFDYGPAPADVLDHARALAHSADANGVHLPELAMQFPLRHPATASVVVGMRTAAQVRSSVARVTARVTERAWAAADSAGLSHG